MGEKAHAARLAKPKVQQSAVGARKSSMARRDGMQPRDFARLSGGMPQQPQRTLRHLTLAHRILIGLTAHPEDGQNHKRRCYRAAGCQSRESAEGADGHTATLQQRPTTRLHRPVPVMLQTPLAFVCNGCRLSAQPPARRALHNGLRDVTAQLLT